MGKQKFSKNGSVNGYAFELFDDGQILLHPGSVHNKIKRPIKYDSIILLYKGCDLISEAFNAGADYANKRKYFEVLDDIKNDLIVYQRRDDDWKKESIKERSKRKREHWEGDRRD